MSRAAPLAMLYPASAQDVVGLVQVAYSSPHGFTVPARCHGHSINGQTQTNNGVMIQMSGGSLRLARQKLTCSIYKAHLLQ
ncbi:hypothetical protein ACFX2K_036126 [Malus domestica]